MFNYDNRLISLILSRLTNHILPVFYNAKAAGYIKTYRWQSDFPTYVDALKAIRDLVKVTGMNVIVVIDEIYEIVVIYNKEKVREVLGQYKLKADPVTFMEKTFYAVLTDIEEQALKEIYGEKYRK